MGPIFSKSLAKSLFLKMFLGSYSKPWKFWKIGVFCGKIPRNGYLFCFVLFCFLISRNRYTYFRKKNTPRYGYGVWISGGTPPTKPNLSTPRGHYRCVSEVSSLSLHQGIKIIALHFPCRYWKNAQIFVSFHFQILSGRINFSFFLSFFFFFFFSFFFFLFFFFLFSFFFLCVWVGREHRGDKIRLESGGGEVKYFIGLQKMTNI